METPAAELLLELGEDLHYPGVTVSGLTLRGADAWRTALPRATAAERRAWFQQLAEPLLVATHVAAERLAAWCARASWSPPITPEWIADHVLLLGDEAMEAEIVAALGLVPPAVADYTAHQVAFRAVGRTSAGWVGPTVVVDRDGRSRPWTCTLSGAGREGAGLVRLVCHEVAHAWLLEVPSAGIGAQGERGLRRYLASTEGSTARLDQHVARDERLADALAQTWMMQ
jgi:hypothetical protein